MITIFVFNVIHIVATHSAGDLTNRIVHFLAPGDDIKKISFICADSAFWNVDKRPSSIESARAIVSNLNLPLTWILMVQTWK